MTIPCYAINKRLKFKDITELKDEESWKKHQIPAEWTDYKTLATEWAEAFDRFKYLKQQYEAEIARRRQATIDHARKHPRGARPRLGPRSIPQYETKLQQARRAMIYAYGRVHEADLYAHFSPVSLISDTNALSDWGGARTPGDSVGKKANVWERIKAVKTKKFYKVDYSDKADEMKPEQKRKEEKNYVEEKGKPHLIPTNITDTDHINTIIDEHIKNPDPKSIRDRIKEWQYKKDWWY